MCMKNININVLPSDPVTNADGSVISFNDVGRAFYASVQKNNMYTVPELSMAVLISATQVKKKDRGANFNSDYTIAFEDEYEVRIRLTETKTGRFMDLDTLRIRPADTSLRHGYCKESFNRTILCSYTDVQLPQIQNGEQQIFVIKVLIRKYDSERKEDKDWIVQTIQPIDILLS